MNSDTRWSKWTVSRNFEAVEVDENIHWKNQRNDAENLKHLDWQTDLTSEIRQQSSDRDQTRHLVVQKYANQSQWYQNTKEHIRDENQTMMKQECERLKIQDFRKKLFEQNFSNDREIFFWRDNLTHDANHADQIKEMSNRSRVHQENHQSKLKKIEKHVKKRDWQDDDFIFYIWHSAASSWNANNEVYLSQTNLNRREQNRIAKAEIVKKNSRRR